MTTDTQPATPIDITFVGRANVDITVRVPDRPVRGGTVFASSMITTPGGKSLNQAIAAARLGGHACLVANVGADQWGDLLRAALVEAGVDVTSFRLLRSAATGAAIIEITPDGENYLILSVSAETELTTADVDRALTRADSPVVVQLDLPPAALAGLLRVPRPRLIIGNLVPDLALERHLLQRLDVLVVNQHEAGLILGIPGVGVLAAAQQLRHLGPAAAVVTAGSDGAAYSSPGREDIVAAPHATVVDTTGAGDAFLGSLALGLARDIPLPEAVAQAVIVGSHAVLYDGAQLPPASIQHLRAKLRR